MKLVILTSSTFFVEEDKILVTLFEEGLERLHLCKPGASPIYMERLLSLLPSNYYKKIFVHGHSYLKNEYGLGGVHVDDVIADAAQLNSKVSCTCHSLGQLATLKKQAGQVFLSSSFSNKADGEGIGMAELEQASRQGLIDKRVFLTGAVNYDHIAWAKKLGFGGIAFQDELWNQFDIHRHTDFKNLIDHFQKLRKAVG